MKKSFSLVLLLAVSVPALAFAEAAGNTVNASTSGKYRLDADKEENYRLKAAAEETSADTPLSQEEVLTPENAEEMLKNSASVNIIKEEIPGGTVEKLVDKDGRVIAEKTIENGEITKKVLNYYDTAGNLTQKVVALDGDTGFYAEEYYPNKQIAAQATYINEKSKIGKEKKYDITGVLRQEITWELPKGEEEKPQNERQTVHTGNIITYYPNGQVAAVFPADNKGTAVFYNRYGKSIKTVKDSKILNFAKELTPNDCIGTSVSLSLEDLVELYEDEGDVSYNKCGLPYRENFMYEITDERGSGALKISYDETGMIRRMTPYLNGQKNGVEQKFDASGNVTAEINYKDGVKNGAAKGYFPTGEKAFEKLYENGQVQGKLSCYFPTGDIAAEFYYKDGKKERGKINSPAKRELSFIDGELADAPQKPARRKIVSNLTLLENPDKKCLDLTQKLENLSLDIEAGANTVMKSFNIEIPEECTDMSAFFPEKSRFVCYDNQNRLRALFPIDYSRGAYAAETIFDTNNKPLYDISFLNKQRQGWTKKYAEDKKVIAEIYFDKGNLASTSRSYHENGAVKEVLSIADNAPRRLVARYAQTGELEFSLTYNKDKRIQAFLSEPQKNKDVYINYYDDKIDNIREVNAKKPQNFIEYNLALGEYAVYRDNELIKGGKICGYEQPSSDVEVISLKDALKKSLPTPEEEAKAPQPDDEIPERLAASSTPLIEDLEPLPAGGMKFKNAVIPTEEEKRQAELAALNIGPVAKPGIDELADVVAKESVEKENTLQPELPSKTEKFYYPNKSLRKTVKTRGSRTEEIKEYSKTGLLLSDTVYKKDAISIEKYSGSGTVRRKLSKNYDDNAVTAFLSRQDFYDTGTPRYEISRKPDSLLFEEKSYYPDGKLKEETTQTAPLSFIKKEYNSLEEQTKITETSGANTLVKEYGMGGTLKSFTLNGKKMPESLEKNSAALLKDNTKTYTKKGAVESALDIKENQTVLTKYYPNGKADVEIIFFNNGEISVKSYNKAGTLEKFAYLAPNGKLHIQKPEVRVIPSYRERWWVDYNNPNWVENHDKYSIKSIARLNIDTAYRILEELDIEAPEALLKLYEVY